MSQPNNVISGRIFTKSRINYANSSKTFIDIALWFRKDDLNLAPQLSLEIDDASIDTKEKNISAFVPYNLKNPENLNKGTWFFYRMSFELEGTSGWRMLHIKLEDTDYFLVKPINRRLLLERFAPEVELFSVFSDSDRLQKLEFEVAKYQLREVMQLPLSALSEIGNTIATKFKSKNVNKIYDLLSVDPSLHFIPDVHAHDLPDAVTKANILNNFRWNRRQWQALFKYNLNQLAILSAEEIARLLEVEITRARNILRRIREVHMTLDRSILQRSGPEIFARYPHSGLKEYQATLNGEDITNEIIVKDGRYVFPTDQLSDGFYAFNLSLLFNSGNRRELTETFTLDTTGPTISLIQPISGSFVNNGQVVIEVSATDELSEVDPEGFKLFIDGIDVSAEGVQTSSGISYNFTDGDEGVHEIHAEARDLFGNSTRSEKWTFTIDRTPPLIQINNPLSPHFTSQDSIKIEGSVTDDHLENIELDGQTINVDQEAFSGDIPLTVGQNTLVISATDKAGNSQFSNTINVYRINSDLAGITGKVLSQQQEPVNGVKIFEPKSEQVTWTDEDGHFILLNVPGGKLTVEIEPNNAFFESAKLTIETEFGQITKVQDIFLIPLLEPAEEQETGKGKTFFDPATPGFELVIPKDTEVSFRGEVAAITMALVPVRQLPYEIPDTFPNCNAAVFGPSGLSVSSGDPMELSLPNELQLPAGEKILMVAIDGIGGTISTAGVASVTEDGTQLRSIEGDGLSHFSVIIPLPTGAQLEPINEEYSAGMDDAVKGGLITHLQLPSFRILNKRQTPRLVYSSLAAAPIVQMSTVFRGMREITTNTKVIEHVHVQQEESAKRVEYFADYSFWLRAYRDHKGNVGINQKMDQEQRRFLTYLPTEVETPHIPFPESIRSNSKPFGSRYEAVLDRLRQQEWKVKLYEIDMRLSVERRQAVWPESITGRCLFSDLDSGEFTIQGPMTPIGPEPHPGEEDTREEHPRLPEDMTLTYHIVPRFQDGTYYPTGLYSWLAKYKINGRVYQQLQSAQVAKKGFFNHDGLMWMLENSEGEKKAELEKLLEVVEKAHDLHRHGPVYASKFAYGDPVDYLMNQEAGQTIIHNLSKSVFGAGWKFEDQHELYPIGRNQVLTIGPDGKQVFTVSNRIQKIKHANFKKIAASRDGKKMYGYTGAYAGWIEKYTHYFSSVYQTVRYIAASKAAEILYPEYEELVIALYRALMDKVPSKEEVKEWTDSDPFQSSWRPYPLFHFTYSDEHLKHVVTQQYRLALDRDPTPEELDNLLPTFWQPSNIGDPSFQITLDGQLYHTPKLIVVATDLFLGLKDEMNYTESNDWILYLWKRLFGGEPGVWELRKHPFNTFKYKSGPDLREALHKYIIQYYWKPWAEKIYASLIGWPAFRAGTFRLIDGDHEEEILLGIPSAGTYTWRAKYRGYKHVRRDDWQHITPSIIETYPDEVYRAGDTSPTITGMAEGTDGQLFVSDSNSNHIYAVAPFDYIRNISTFHYSSGGSSSSNVSIGVVLGAMNPINMGGDRSGVEDEFTYFDENGNAIQLPEEEAKQVAVYREYVRKGGDSKGIYSKPGYTPDGTYFDSENEKLKLFPIDTPGGIAVDDHDNLYFAETGNHRVRKLNLKTGVLKTIAGNGAISQYDPKVSDACKTSIPEPTDLVISKKSEIYFLFNVGLGQQCLGKIDRAGYYTHVAGSAIPGQGTLDIGIDAIYYKLVGATSLAASPTGEIYISIPSQHRVMVVTPDGFIDMAAGNGESGIPLEGAPALQTPLGNPEFITCDRHGNLIINDPKNKVLRMVSLASNDQYCDTNYQAPPGYFDAKLTQHSDGTWSKVYKDRSVVRFDRLGRHIATVDKNHNKTKYTYENDRLKKVSYPLGGYLDFEYLNDGTLSASTDHVGRRTFFEVDEGYLKKVTHADGQEIMMAYDDSGRLLSSNAGNGNEISYNYNQYGRLIAQTTNGQLTQIERPDDLAAGNLSQENSEALIAFENLTSVISGEGNRSTFRINHGKVVEYLPSEGGKIRIQYNFHGLPELIKRSSGSQIEISYNEQGDRLTLRDSFTGSFIETIYDALGSKLEERNSEGIVAKFTYDRKGNLLQSSLSRNDDSVVVSEKEYSENGLVEKRIRKGVETVYVYNDQGNLIGESRGYIETQLERDLAGNILKEKKGDIERHFTYDQLNRLLITTDGEDSSQYTYDLQGNLSTISDAVGGTQKLDYDGRNRLVRVENRGGMVWEFEYDWEDRLIETRFPDGTNLTREWQGRSGMDELSGDWNRIITYFDDGSKRSAWTEVGAFSKTIDESGRIISYLSIVEDQVFVLDYELNTINQFLSIKSDGQELIYSHSPFGQIETIDCGPFNLHFKYDENGHLTEIARGNGWKTSHEPDEAGFFSNTKDEHASLGEIDKVLEIDAGGKITSRKQSNNYCQYTYDSKAQLTKVLESAVSRNYHYDKIGNRLSGPAGEYQYDEQHHLLLSCPNYDYLWNAHGQLVEKKAKNSADRHTYSYFPNGQLASFKNFDAEEIPLVAAEYHYDANHRRIRKVVNYRDEPEKNQYKHWIYHGTNAFFELNEQMQIVRQYVSGETDAWFGFIEGEEAYYFLVDHLGSVQKVVNSNGEEVASYRYDEFGQLLESSEQVKNSIRFTGREYDEESGLYYFRMRHYDPSLGRFIQPDPYLGSTEKSKTLLNRYAYVNNNPLTYTDPSGLSPHNIMMAGEATMWILEMIWEIIKFLLSPGAGKAAADSTVKAGDFRTDQEVASANTDIYSQLRETTELLGDVLDQAIGSVLGEMWDKVSDWFDWGTPEIELPSLDEVTGSDFPETSGIDLPPAGDIPMESSIPLSEKFYTPLIPGPSPPKVFPYVVSIQWLHGVGNENFMYYVNNSNHFWTPKNHEGDAIEGFYYLNYLISQGLSGLVDTVATLILMVEPGVSNVRLFYGRTEISLVDTVGNQRIFLKRNGINNPQVLNGNRVLYFDIYQLKGFFRCTYKVGADHYEHEWFFGHKTN